jgi:homoaconitase/3-isopropylmalate dehydratase large subunit
MIGRQQRQFRGRAEKSMIHLFEVAALPAAAAVGGVSVDSSLSFDQNCP